MRLSGIRNRIKDEDDMNLARPGPVRASAFDAEADGARMIRLHRDHLLDAGQHAARRFQRLAQALGSGVAEPESR
jgi:hypothetical protein